MLRVDLSSSLAQRQDKHVAAMATAPAHACVANHANQGSVVIHRHTQLLLLGDKGRPCAI